MHDVHAGSIKRIHRCDWLGEFIYASVALGRR
jgi:hypothetical protein